MKRKIKRVCIVNTSYSLLIYLSNSSIQEIDETFYFFGNGIPSVLQKNFKLRYTFDFNSNQILNNKLVLLFLIKYGKYFIWPFFRKSEIFAQDHLPFSPYLIGYKKYTLIEDCPNFYFRFYSNMLRLKNLQYWREDKYKKRYLWKCIVGPTYSNINGDNSSCTALLLTDKTFIPIKLKSKIIIAKSLKEIWNNFDKEKKTLILSRFNFSINDVSLIRSKKKILFTQPFSDDMYITKDEQYRIYNTIISNYSRSEIIIKTHPRDTSDYRNLFPDILVFDKPIPFQLFDLFDIKFDTAITVNSSAAKVFDYKIKIDWYGSRISESLLNSIGNF